MLYGCLASSAARARVRGSDDPSFMAPHDADITSRRAPMIDEMDAWWRITQSPMDRVAHIPTCTDVADVSAGAARAPACRTYATARRRPWHSAETPDDAAVPGPRMGPDVSGWARLRATAVTGETRVGV